MDRVEAFVLTNLELLCVATLLGMESIYGYKMEETRFDEDAQSIGQSDNMTRRLKYTLYDLVKKQYIEVETDSKSGRIKIDDNVRKIFSIIKDARSIIEIQCVASNEKLIIYRNDDSISGGKAVVLRPNLTKEEEVLLSIINDIDIYDYLVDEGYVSPFREVESFTYEKVYRDNLCEDKLLYIKKISRQCDIKGKYIKEISSLEIYETYIYSVENKEYYNYTTDEFRKLMNI